ncbi:hypothetical protein [Mesorhizobium comanense]|uniref:hypothetical protein n=1 Tax=Mesorhizobium comanense TaxID=2502215 RepID=UPI0010F4F4C6|nr:hypothetical protein [Mesorhizobium comanense]
MEELGGSAERPQRVVVTVHGIRTFGQWQDRLRDLIHKRAPDVTVEPFRYGYFSALAFAFPFFRWLAVLFFRARLRDLIRRHPNARFVFVAHSFGTHLTVHGLKGLNKDEVPAIDLIILAGSVLRPNFNWPRFMEKVPARQVVNDCGINDSVLILSQFVVLLTGMAGRVGFYGFTGGNVLNRFFVGGHGLYFASNRHDANHFMRTQWLSSIVDDAQPMPVDQRPPFGVLGGLSNATVRLSDPLKLVLYGALVWFAYDTLYRQPRLELIAEQGSREVAVAATAMENDLRMPTSYQSAIRVAKLRGQVRDRDRALAEDIARYSGQRLATFADALKSLEPGAVFRWSGVSYVAADPPLRLPGAPAWFARAGEPARLLTIDTDSTVAVVDAGASRTVARQRIREEHEGPVVGATEVLSLKSVPNMIGLELVVERPNDDDLSHYAVTVDLATGAIESHAGGDERTTFTATPDCSAFKIAKDIDDYDEDNLSADQLQALRKDIQEETAITARCVERSVARVPKTFVFPKLIEENANWRVARVMAETPPDPQALTPPCQSLSESVKFPHVIRPDGSILDFSKTGRNEQGELVEDNPEIRFIDPETGEGKCYVEFQGAGGKTFALNYRFAGEWHISYAICEVLDGRTVGRCVSPGFAWNGSGDIVRSPDGNLLVVSGFGAGSAPPWNITDLRTMQTTFREDPTFGRVSGIAFGADSRTVAVAGPLEGMAGALRLVIYDLADPIKPLASRIIESSAAPEPLAQDVANPLDTVAMFGSDGGFVVAMPYGDVFGFQLADYNPLPEPAARLLEALGGANERSSAITLDWLATPLGFSPQAQIRFDFEPGQRQLLAYDRRQARLMDTTGGYMLTGLVRPAELPGCSGDIGSAQLEADGRISVSTGTCAAERAAPLDFKSVPQTASQARMPQPADPSGHRELPEERATQEQRSMSPDR